MLEPPDREAGLSPVKRALIEQRRLKARIEELERERTEPIAIIGAGCRFPGAAGTEEFWNMLQRGTDAIREVPAERWDIDALYSPDADAPGRVATRWGGFLDRLDLFDAEFFGISPREAAAMDPQQRLALEIAWEALENAAQPFAKLSGSNTGVFIGAASNDYLQLQAGYRDTFDAYLATGNSHSVIAGRISYLLGLQGPSIAVDTACSSSLVAIHLACQSLHAGDCQMAIAGGVNVLLWEGNTISLSKAHMMAADGRCKTFDAAADGFVRAEGCGMVVLKRLSQARRDGDHVIVVILGSACNQDGRSSGLTAPNGPAQEAVIRRALDRAGIEGREIGYVETHGTGTSLGDPIEIRALGNVLCRDRANGDPLMIGSLKTNLGHLEAAAGVAGVIKAALAVERGMIPPHLHFTKPNPHIPWDEYALSVPASLTPWNPERKRAAGVSGFGFNGTNAHIIVGQAVEEPAGEGNNGRPRHILAFSAKTPEALQALAGRYLADFLQKDLAVCCFTINSGRAHMDVRAAITASTMRELCDGLAGVAQGRESSAPIHRGIRDGVAPQVAFLFTGQGSQYAGMGRELYESEPVFRAALDRCASGLKEWLPRPLLEVLFEDGSDLHETQYTQPALFAIEYSLAEMWRSWGIEPSVVLGHSVGEYAAACVAGVFSLEDGLKLVAARGRLMQQKCAAGAMAAVFASESAVQEVMGGEVSIAAINGPANTVISGSEQAVEAARERLKQRGVESSRLVVSHGFHSRQMEPMLEEFERVAETVRYQRPKIALISNLTGGRVSEEVCGSGYWRRHAREAVRFAEGIRAVVEQGCGAMLEVGPQPVLCGMGKQCVDGVDWFGTLRRGRGAWDEVLNTLAELYVRGVGIDWEAFDRHHARRRLRLPTYPFQRQRHWAESLDASPRDRSRSNEGRWKLAVDSASRQANQVPIDLELAAFPAKWEALEQLTTARILSALREFGLFVRSGERYSLPALLEAAGIRDSFRNLIARWLDRMVGLGLLQCDREEYSCGTPLPAANWEFALGRAREIWRDSPLLIAYLERCCAAAADILQGRTSPLEALFPGGSFETAEFLYETWALPRYFNEIIRAALHSFAQAAGRRPLRVLEVGAGTGSTTGSALAALAGVDAEYWFTDLSDLFLARAERRFADYSGVHYRVFDLDRDPAEQGVALHSFDVIVAANVLHATRDLGMTLERVKSLLGTGGLLLAFEVTEHMPWFDISVGLIEGWQKHSEDWRRAHPLLKPEQWSRLLLEHAFEAVHAFPEPSSPAEILGHHVLLGLAPRIDENARGGTSSIDPIAATVQDSRPSAARDQQTGWLDGLPALPESERTETLVEFIRDHVAAVLRMDRAKVGRTQRLTDLGIDSLMAVEIAARLTAGLKLPARLPSTLVFDHATILGIAVYLNRTCVAPPSPEPEPKPSRDIASLSEDEAEALLLAKLREIE